MSAQRTLTLAITKALRQWHEEYEAEHGCIAHDEGLHCCVDLMLTEIEEEVERRGW